MTIAPNSVVSQYEPADLACLYEITSILASSSDLRDCVEEIMEILAGSTGMQHGTVTIINPKRPGNAGSTRSARASPAGWWPAAPPSWCRRSAPSRSF
jgi:hypothetical protein